MKMGKPPSQETERNLNSEEYAMRLADPAIRFRRILERPALLA